MLAFPPTQTGYPQHRRISLGFQTSSRPTRARLLQAKAPVKRGHRHLRTPPPPQPGPAAGPRGCPRRRPPCLSLQDLRPGSSPPPPCPDCSDDSSGSSGEDSSVDGSGSESLLSLCTPASSCSPPRGSAPTGSQAAQMVEIPPGAGAAGPHVGVSAVCPSALEAQHHQPPRWTLVLAALLWRRRRRRARTSRHRLHRVDKKAAALQRPGDWTINEARTQGASQGDSGPDQAKTVVENEIASTIN